MKIPISKAINSQSWYHCQMECWTETLKDDEIIDYRIQVLSFEKVDLEQVDGAQHISLDLRNGILWKLEVDVVNLWKKTMGSFPVHNSVVLVDQDGTEFKPVTDRHLTDSWGSEYAVRTGLNLLNGSTGDGCGELIPKVPLHGAMAFLLPTDENTRYYLSVEGGRIHEEHGEGAETETQHDNGWIYILTNPAFEPSLLKIGVTQRTPEKRASEISTKTGVPKPFKVSFEIEVGKCKKVEKVIHDKLAKYRYVANREFFELPLEKVVPFIKKVAAYFPKEKVPDPEELKRQERINQIKEQIKHLTEELGDLEKK